jgi:hypothetical protein
MLKKSAKPKESLVEWVLRGNAELMAEKERQPASAEPRLQASSLQPVFVLPARFINSDNGTRG